MAETEYFNNPLPDEGDLDDVPKDLAAYGNALEKILWERARRLLGFDGAADAAAGQIIIVNGTGDPVYKAVTGNVTISTSGVTTLADRTVTSRKFKPTVGERGSGEIALTGAYQNMPGIEITITPDVESSLIMLMSYIIYNPEAGLNIASVRPVVDGAGQNAKTFSISPSLTVPVYDHFLADLSAGGAHTIKMQAKGAGARVLSSSILYFLVGS